MTETYSDKELEFHIGYTRIRAKELPIPPLTSGKAVFQKGSPFFAVKRDSLRILEITT